MDGLSRQQAREGSRREDNSVFGEVTAQLFQGARNAHPGGVLRQPQCRAGLLEAAVVEEAQQDGLPLLMPQGVEGIVKDRSS